MQAWTTKLEGAVDDRLWPMSQSVYSVEGIGFILLEVRLARLGDSAG